MEELRRTSATLSRSPDPEPPGRILFPRPWLLVRIRSSPHKASTGKFMKHPIISCSSEGGFLRSAQLNLSLLSHHTSSLAVLLVKRRFARSFSAVPFSRRIRRAYSWLESSPATVARPRVVVSISSGWGTAARERPN